MNSKQYMKEIGLFEINQKKVRNYIKKVLSHEDFKKFKSIFENETQEEMYEFKNTNYKKSIAICNAFDYHIIKYLLEYIETNLSQLEENILDIGCDNGIITCFIALMNPKSKVVGIDPQHDSLIIANEIAQKYSLDNVTFVQATSESYKTNIKFDKIFTSRTFGANYTPSNELPFTTKVKEYVISTSNSISKYLNEIDGFLSSNGKIINFERVVMGFGVAEWLYKMNEMKYNCLSLKSIRLKELDFESFFSFAEFDKKDFKNISIDEILEKIAIVIINNSGMEGNFYFLTRYLMECKNFNFKESVMFSNFISGEDVMYIAYGSIEFDGTLIYASISLSDNDFDFYLKTSINGSLDEASDFFQRYFYENKYMYDFNERAYIMKY